MDHTLKDSSQSYTMVKRWVIEYKKCRRNTNEEPRGRSVKVRIREIQKIYKIYKKT